MLISLFKEKFFITIIDNLFLSECLLKRKKPLFPGENLSYLLNTSRIF